MFRKVLIVNRGAIARRVVRACHALGIASAVVYSEADADAPYLAEATEAWPLAGVAAAETYLNLPVLMACLAASGADAVHPGYGFLAENPALAEAVTRTGAVFIGPGAKWLRAMGDKVAARRLTAEQGFPTFPGSTAVADLEAARAAAEAIGVATQIALAAGGALPAQPPLNGFAVEARVYCEDPHTGLPATGRLSRLRELVLHGVRALEVQGVATNVPLLERVLQHPEFLAGEIDTGFLGRLQGRRLQGGAFERGAW